MKICELTKGVPKGSQKRAKHPLATDDPDKYVGKWEAYDTPQGLSNKKKTDEGDASFGAGWTGRGVGSSQSPLPDEIYNKPPKEIEDSKKSPLEQVTNDVIAMNGGTVFGIGGLDESIRTPNMGTLSGEYYVQDKGDDVGYALVENGVIVKILIKNQIVEKYTGEILTKLLLLILREADWNNANLTTQIKNDTDLSMRRFLERFGFRYSKQGIMMRNAGSIKPPSA